MIAVLGARRWRVARERSVFAPARIVAGAGSCLGGFDTSLLRVRRRRRATGRRRRAAGPRRRGACLRGRVAGARRRVACLRRRVACLRRRTACLRKHTLRRRGRRVRLRRRAAGLRGFNVRVDVSGAAKGLRSPMNRVGGPNTATRGVKRKVSGQGTGISGGTTSVSPQGTAVSGGANSVSWPQTTVGRPVRRGWGAASSGRRRDGILAVSGTGDAARDTAGMPCRATNLQGSPCVGIFCHDRIRDW